MSWMSPLTVPITILPIGSTPVSANKGRKISMPPFMALAASSTSGTNRMPSRKSTPTMRMPSTKASSSTRAAVQPRPSRMLVASMTSSRKPLYRSSCTCSVSSSSLSVLRSRSSNSSATSNSFGVGSARRLGRRAQLIAMYGSLRTVDDSLATRDCRHTTGVRAVHAMQTIGALPPVRVVQREFAVALG